jgi:hypothetical protein
MSSSRATAVRVLRLRVKDKHAEWLCGLAREVNTVFNYCNELSVKVFERERRFLSGFDFWPFLKGVTRGDCALHLPVQAVQEIAEEYARRRRQHQKIRLAWRKSRSRPSASTATWNPPWHAPSAPAIETEPERFTPRSRIGEKISCTI